MRFYLNRIPQVANHLGKRAHLTLLARKILCHVGYRPRQRLHVLLLSLDHLIHCSSITQNAHTASDFRLQSGNIAFRFLTISRMNRTRYSHTTKLSTSSLFLPFNASTSIFKELHSTPTIHRTLQQPTFRFVQCALHGMSSQ